jgi:hypothetical protein
MEPEISLLYSQGPLIIKHISENCSADYIANDVRIPDVWFPSFI